MSEYHSFSEEATQSAIETAQQHYGDAQANFLASESLSISQDNGQLSLLAHCITLTISNGKVCLNLPLGIGKVCLPVPISYNGKLAEACISVCTVWGIPTGVKVNVTVGGMTVVSKSFGRC